MLAKPPWASGPGEILKHGVSLLADDTDSKRRLAMISIDNSVELMLQTFITLPKRITGLDITRKTRDEICKNFPSLLDGIEEHASDKIIGLDLGEIEWFHRIRNNLYHEGNGLTVARSQVELYAELAQKLFESLFNISLEIPSSENMDKFGQFMEAWITIEKSLQSHSPDKKLIFNNVTLQKMVESGEISNSQANDIVELRKIRNELVHGTADPSKALSRKIIKLAEEIAKSIVHIL